MGEAARKYNIPATTLHRWAVGKQIVKVLARDGQKVLLDEQDVAYCAEVYKNNKGQGKRVLTQMAHHITIPNQLLYKTFNSTLYLETAVYNSRFFCA